MSDVPAITVIIMTVVFNIIGLLLGFYIGTVYQKRKDEYDIRGY